MFLRKHRKLLIFLMDFFITSMISYSLFRFSLLRGSSIYSLGFFLLRVLFWFACIIMFQVMFHTYDSLWRYAEEKEYLFLLLGGCCGTGLYLLLSRALFQPLLPVPFMLSVLSISSLLTLLVRFLYRMYRDAIRKLGTQQIGTRRKIGIIGAGEAGVSLLKEMLDEEHSLYCPILLLDDDPQQIGMKVRGVPVMGPICRTPDLIRETGITELVLAIPSCSPNRRREILHVCALAGCKLRVLPDREDVLSGPLMSQIRAVRAEDLLGRAPIRLTGHGIREMIRGQTVLVTGGGGSIGSELCRQIAALAPRELIVLDCCETGVADLQQELRRKYGDKLNLTVEISSITDASHLRRLFRRRRPDLVFHAAAHKHVPLMEACPQEAVRNNVFGTLNAVNAAHEAGVRKFVLISTDKAVNPTSIMGATKRVCEMILAGMRSISDTEFVAVRFGNVLGSSGSVIPLFQKQIEQGGPVTVTDKRILRYFMTISEAVSLVLQAGAMARRSEVFVLDMGKPVRILELAENLIRLSGHTPYTEIPIVEVGLRPGEKLYEEPLLGGTRQRRTDNELIFVEDEQPVTRDQMAVFLQDLRIAVTCEDPAAVLNSLHRCVPEFHTPEEVNRAFLDAAPVQNAQAVSF